jgi:transcriptional regulator with XRE-family HTH domain
MTSDLAAEARRLRAEEGLSVRQITQRLGVGRDRVRGWLRGIPAPGAPRRQ